jgi:hypothetical protein
VVSNLEKIKINNMCYFLIGIMCTTLWLVYEFYRAPMMDENGRITKEGKKLKDLFKKKV